MNETFYIYLCYGIHHLLNIVTGKENEPEAVLIRACEKRPVSMAQIDTMVSAIEKEVYNSLDQEIKSSRIGELVMEQLKKVDEVSYIRFASVYRKFADLTHFIEFIQEYDDNK